MASSGSLLGVLLPIGLVLIFGYAAYWAFAIRRSLAIRVYRNQALGVGLIALGPLLFSLELLVTGGSPAGPGTPLLDAGYIATGFGLTLLVFYWIDASVLAARRGDPLLRDSFHWKRLRILLWIVNVAGVVASVVGVFSTGFGSIGFPLSTFSGALVTNLWLLPTLATAISGIIVLPTSAFRSGDAVLRTHLKWFALFSGAQLILIMASALGIILITSISEASAGSLLEFATSLVGGYCLYRSARSLVPLNRLSITKVN